MRIPPLRTSIDTRTALPPAMTLERRISPSSLNGIHPSNPAYVILKEDSVRLMIQECRDTKRHSMHPLGQVPKPNNSGLNIEAAASPLCDTGT